MLFVSFVLILHPIAPARNAQDPDAGFLRLTHPGQPTAWDHGESGVSGWKVTKHGFEAGLQAAPLVSGFTFGEFELRLGWTAPAGGALVLEFPFVETDGAFRVRLTQHEATLEVPGSTAALKRKSPATGLQPLTVRRHGERLEVRILQDETLELNTGPEPRVGLIVASATPGCAIDSPEVREPAGRSLFNGEDLTGWWCDGSIEVWQPVDGEIRRVPKDGKQGKYLRSEEEFGDFVLSFEYSMPPNGNSGVGIRTPRDGWPSKQGMELQLLHEPRGGPRAPPLGPQSEMAIYSHVPPLCRAYLPEEWNRVVIKADGPVISAWVNGVLCQHFDTGGHEVLRDRRRGWIGFQDHGASIRIRHVRVLEAGG